MIQVNVFEMKARLSEYLDRVARVLQHSGSIVCCTAGDSPRRLADSVSSVHRASGYGGVPSNNYFIRGFRTRGSYRNGMCSR